MTVSFFAGLISPLPLNTNFLFVLFENNEDYHLKKKNNRNLKMSHENIEITVFYFLKTVW